jgi:hypothetical protein
MAPPDQLSELLLQLRCLLTPQSGRAVSPKPPWSGCLSEAGPYPSQLETL